MSFRDLQGNVRVGTVMGAAGIGLGVLMSTLTPAAGLNREQQMLSGGFNQGPNVTTAYTAPGWTTALQADYPSPGDGENAVQLRLPAGRTLSNLKVRVRTQNTPTAGSLIVMVRINNADTTLTCTVFGTSNCNSHAEVAVRKNDRLAIQITSTLADEGNFTLSYTLLYD